MAIALSNVKRVSSAPGSSVFTATLTFSGSYSTNGDTLDLSKLPFKGLPKVPDEGRITGIAGYQYVYIPGATPDVCKVKVNCNTAGGSNAGLGEHTAATYNAGVSGDTVTAKFEIYATVR